NEFTDYFSILGITATLSVADESGQQIGGYPLKLERGELGGDNLPQEPFVFIRTGGEAFTGSDSLNDVVSALHRQLTLEVKLDDVYPDRDTKNNSKTLGPLTSANSKPIT